MACHDRHGRREIALALLALLDHPHPEGTFGRIGLRERADHRQGHLALAEVVADVLSEPVVGAAVVEQVVGDLEGDAERVAIIAKRAGDLRLRPGDHRAGLGGRREERRGLAADHLQIDRLVGREIGRGGQLQHLALGDHRRGVRQDVEHLQVAGLHH